MRSGRLIGICTLVLMLVFGFIFFSRLEKIEAGYVGIKVNMLGSDKGIDDEVLDVGRYWVGFNEEIYKFPTFQQTVSWNNSNDNFSGAFQFQSKEGLSLSADVSTSYTIDRNMVTSLFKKYRRGIDEITSVYLYNDIRNAMVRHASVRSAENLYGEGKAEFISDVMQDVKERMKPVGINIDYIAIVGNVWLPEQVKQAIDAKVQAGQLAAQRETEVATARAEAEKSVAAAEGEARSRKAIADANAYVIIKEAEAQKMANELLASSITKELIEYNRTKKWDGKLPQVTGTDMNMMMNTSIR